MDKKYWLISVDMGYGHQRTAYPLKDLACPQEPSAQADGRRAFEEKIINANSYKGIPQKDKKIWETTRNLYEFISDFKKIPSFGDFIFYIFDQFQKIFTFYPKRDLSSPNFQLKQTFSLIKKGWGRDLIEKIKKDPRPLITPFFTPAFMAEYFKYPGEIFCIVCDTDISRTWATLDPKSSRIKYFAPTERVVERLKLYGVRPENVFFTGYPLPLENIGGEQLEILKEDLKNRILNLDPRKRYFNTYEILIDKKLGKLPEKSDHPLTILFSVGGAGAQKEIAITALKNLYPKIKSGEIKMILSAGTKSLVKEYFLKNIKKLNLNDYLDKTIEVIFEKDFASYFEEFNKRLRKTDILWTKPSELSFYAALGLPIIISPPVGSQEEFNRRWLLKSGYGISQENPNYINDWLFDWLDNGYLAEAAMQGFIEGNKLGTLNIRKIACGY